MRKVIAITLAFMMTAFSLSSNLLAATEDPVTVSATVSAAARQITTSPASLTWNMPAGTITAHRFNSPVITIDFYGGNQAGGYKIRAYTQNATAGDGRGYLAKGADKLYLKVWCANFGPGYARVNPDSPPGINSYFWEGYDFNGDGDKTDWGKNGTLAAGVKYDEAPAALDFDITGDGDKNDKVEVAGAGADPDTFVYDGQNAKYWLGESASYSWIADKPTLATYEVKLIDDINPLASGFKVALAADVEGVPDGTYNAADTGVMFDILAR